MLRCLKALLIVATVLLAATPARAANWRKDECRMNFGSLAWTTWDVRHTILCATEKWTVPGGTTKALQVATCESGDDLLDHSTDGYAGTYQQAVVYWPKRRVNLKPPGWELPPSVYNPRANVIVSVRMAHAAGWGAWSCA